MPFKSQAQRHYFEANKAKLEKQGVNVKEWEESSKGLKLPERAPRYQSKRAVRELMATKEQRSIRTNP